MVGSHPVRSSHTGLTPEGGIRSDIWNPGGIVATDPTSLPPADAASSLDVERGRLARILVTHRAHIARARATAERLAAEAAEMTEEGIRDLVDEDAEVDAAVRAALVRQTSDRAMHAVRRAADLEALGEAMAFGHMTDEAGERLYIGRHSVIEGDEALLVDWRARASMPFYRATAIERLGLTARRHLLYGEEAQRSELVGFSDEVFDLEGVIGQHGLRGEAAVLASVTAPTESQMRSVVATIQAEQDAVVRAPASGPLVVQGGPGTGKTVVALHRAAYLLYDQRAELSDTGVLIVGPSSQFLRYIAGVLPSLGESGVVSVTAPALYPGVFRGLAEAPEVAAVKGKAAMAELLANAVVDRQRTPTEQLVVRYGATRARVAVDRLTKCFQRAQRYVLHNEGADAFRALVIESLCAAVFDPSFRNREDALETFSSSPEVERFLVAHWPPLTPEQALNDLLGSPTLLRLAARDADLTRAELRLLHRPLCEEDTLADRRWSNADIPLLDELLVLVGGVIGGQSETERMRERDAADEFELSIEADEALEVDDASEVESIEFDDEEDEDELFAVSLNDPMFDDMGSDGSEYGITDRRTLEDDRYDYG